MRLYGLIGYPLSHSFSKKYFSDKFEKEGIVDCAYELFPISSIGELPALLASHPQLCGLNVTIPYKEQVVSYLHQKNQIVTQIHACNCIKIENGKLTGFNTDVMGFEQSLREQLKPHHKKALILGTGGVAKAVQFVLNKLGISFHNVSRNASYQNLSYEQVTPELLKEYTLIINTTPLGMYPAITEAAPIPYEALSSSHYLFDMVYNPEKTLFLRKGEDHGATIKNGYDMLEIQAEESWKIWSEVI